VAEDLTVAVSDGVAVLTLNRPSALNAYSEQMGQLLGQAYRRCDEDDDIRVIVVTGAGAAFCVGADFSGGADPFAARDGDAPFSASPIRPAAFELRTPVIAALNGHAIGIGFTIALQADIRYVAEDAKYGVVQARRGVLGDCMSHWTLPRIAGMTAAAEILLTGRVLSGADAVAMGIASRALPADGVLSHAVGVATDIATNVAPMSAALSKRLLWDTAINGYSPEQVASLETQLHERVMGTADAREGIEAFRDRRTPRWTTSVSAEWTDLPEPRPH
jgi:enoyl-CoA hydratase/carnithine racemase